MDPENVETNSSQNGNEVKCDNCGNTFRGAETFLNHIWKGNCRKTKKPGGKKFLNTSRKLKKLREEDIFFL
ncbi:hypothetical protein A3I25_00620 [Candidatus Nomurabacteria bacterium RIFCSPLOWO2_02_FULL_42_17]|uniref:C2H2-type domain-containing protein n=2 Tax=Candidatus Nomuraibacteriota TaxID=1752729 RepID=A0A1F6WJY7_9BACT|nr:MAG: hypothetical protein A3B93_00655 [Candidatus Nomurabacteria bacterium RIFCSPHIGHO2_02_FULL_42_24]OGI96131.1 MAG: hypothetical protein A3I25_00620 [Candidatus Nomurabacteria bacterium RIFCSPLOWO2_02_FULL_42_17]